MSPVQGINLDFHSLLDFLDEFRIGLTLGATPGYLIITSVNHTVRMVTEPGEHIHMSLLGIAFEESVFVRSIDACGCDISPLDSLGVDIDEIDVILVGICIGDGDGLVAVHGELEILIRTEPIPDHIAAVLHMQELNLIRLVPHHVPGLGVDLPNRLRREERGNERYAHIQPVREYARADSGDEVTGICP